MWIMVTRWHQVTGKCCWLEYYWASLVHCLLQSFFYVFLLKSARGLAIKRKLISGFRRMTFSNTRATLENAVGTVSSYLLKKTMF
jgi:hypothetical protein